MHADRELARLAERKLLLQARITVRRLECVLAGERLAPPLRFADRIVAVWRQVSPLVKAIAIPLGIFAASRVSKSKDAGSAGDANERHGARKGWLSAWLSALPVLLEIGKVLREPRRSGAKARG